MSEETTNYGWKCYETVGDHVEGMEPVHRNVRIFPTRESAGRAADNHAAHNHGHRECRNRYQVVVEQ